MKLLHSGKVRDVYLDDSDDRGDLVLVASELATNAIRHGRPPVTLELRRQTQAVRLDVHDGDPTEPVLTAATADVESGRGLAIVRALADSVAVEQVTGDGKILRASFTTEQEAPRAV